MPSAASTAGQVDELAGADGRGCAGRPGLGRPQQVEPCSATSSSSNADSSAPSRPAAGDRATRSPGRRTSRCPSGRSSTISQRSSRAVRSQISSASASTRRRSVATRSVATTPDRRQRRKVDPREPRRAEGDARQVAVLDHARRPARAPRAWRPEAHAGEAAIASASRPSIGAPGRRRQRRSPPRRAARRRPGRRRRPAPGGQAATAPPPARGRSRPGGPSWCGWRHASRSRPGTRSALAGQQAQAQLVEVGGHRSGVGALVSGSAPDWVLGKAITSRMFSSPTSRATSRSIPKANPACGGAP